MSRLARARTTGTLLLFATAVLLQAGCASHLLESKLPAPETFRLGLPPPAAESAPTAGVELVVTVARPRAPSALDTTRIAVVPAPRRFEYYSEVRWAESAPQMFQQSLVAGLEASGRFSGVVAAPARVPSELLLDVELRHFEAVASAGGGAPAAHVQVQASLVDARRGTRVTSFVSEARAPATRNQRDAIVAAFEQAHAQVVTEIVARVGEAVAALDRAAVPPGVAPAVRGDGQ